MPEIIIIKKNATLINLNVNTDNLNDIEKLIDKSHKGSLEELLNIDNTYYLYGYTIGSALNINKFKFKLLNDYSIKPIYNDCICMKKINNKLTTISRIEFLKKFKFIYTDLYNSSNTTCTEIEYNKIKKTISDYAAKSNNKFNDKSLTNKFNDKSLTNKSLTNSFNTINYEKHTDCIELLIKLNKYLVNKQLDVLDTKTNTIHPKIDEVLTKYDLSSNINLEESPTTSFSESNTTNEETDLCGSDIITFDLI